MIGTTLGTILMILALVLFGIAAVLEKTIPVRLVYAGLAAWTLAIVLGGFHI